MKINIVRVARNRLPRPPAPPLVIKRSRLFGGEVETEESKLANALWRGQMHMWERFMAEIDGTTPPIALPNTQ